MKRPATATMALGHPLIGPPLALGMLAIGYAGWQTSNVVVLILALVALTKIGKSIEAASAYKAWCKAWNSMHPDASRRRLLRRASGKGVVIGLLILTLLVFGRTADLLHYASYAPYGLVPLAIGWGAVTFLRRGRNLRARAARIIRPVMIIAKPVLPVPSLIDAYRALPPYCQALLERRS